MKTRIYSVITRNILNKWLLALIICSIFCITNSCEGILKLDLVGDGNKIIQNRFVSNVKEKELLNSVKEVELIENFILNIVQSVTRELYVEADSNLMAYIETIIEKERLIIKRKDNYNLSPRRPINLVLAVEDLKAILVSDGGRVNCDTLNFETFNIKSYNSSTVTARCLNSNQLNYFSEGGANAKIHGCFNQINIRQIGSGESVLSGSSSTLSVSQEGSGKVDALELNSGNANIILYGSGLVFCAVKDKLNVKIKGKGRVYYIGNPSLTSSVEGGGILLKDE